MTIGVSLGKSTSPSKPILRDVTSGFIIFVTTVALPESCCLSSKNDAVVYAFAVPPDSSHVEALPDSDTDPIPRRRNSRVKMTERHGSIATPSCPSCEGPMILRTNRRDSSTFYGCRRYPACSGTRDIGSNSTASQVEDASDSSAQFRVLWNDATLDRTGWQCRYTMAGGRLRSSPSLMEVSSEFRQCWIARTQGTFIAADSVRRVTGAIRKLIQRGSNPPIHPHAERELLDSWGFGGSVRPSALPGDISVRLEPDVFQGLANESIILPGLGFERDDEILFDSGHERQFISAWVPQNLDPWAPRWFVPQASLDALTAPLSGYSPSGRRVDFLVSPPFGTPFVVEIDGPQHQDSSGPDDERDQMLAKVGIEVIRVPTSELDQGGGANLERVRALWPQMSKVSDKRMADAVLVPPSIHRLVTALLDAVDFGFLGGQRWIVEVDGEPDVAPSLLWPYVRLFMAMDRLWGPSMMPEEILVKTKHGWARFDTAASEPPTAWEPHEIETNLIIRLQPHLSAFDKLGRANGDTPEIVVRSAHLPIIVGDDLFEPAMRSDLDRVDPRDIEPALTEILQAVFAKQNFKEGQLQALVEIMGGRDCTVLLPTGAGKSLIYQLAGICKPGRTIIIDPLIALIEDQQRSLKEHGIDKVVGFSSFQVGQGRLDALLRQVALGDALFIFVAPERFQQRRFRDSIKALIQATPINLAVIDEAHCVSEWGHQFRTSYLTLGKVLREVCKDAYDLSPPLLALTGTASRAVLKDVLTQLAISTDSARSIVRPASFDRPELVMETRQCSPKDSPSVLTGSLQALPSKFGVPATEFFRPLAERTFSGLIFCPHVSGQHGVTELQRVTGRVVGLQPAIYSGGSPKERGRAIFDPSEWEQKKRELAESFKENRIPLMVSTNAFGMGIDKPNIRYVFHYGLPGSMEAYYQEVGRAGRDQGRAYCLLIWNEQDRARSDRLTITDSLEDVREEFNRVRRSEDDSITHQLYFLLKTFKGVDVELAEIERVVSDSEFRPYLGNRSTIVLAKGTKEEADKRERALYRLMLLGVVEDYLVESTFLVNLANISSAGIAAALSEFVRRTAPGASRQTVNEFVAQANSMEIRQALSIAARELIGFIYDVIVESRRRSLREMYVAVRDASPGGDGLRSRVLAYLTEGDISPVLEAIVESDEFDYAVWEQELVKLQGVDDARELRGSSARLLDSFPSNPGLLYARAYAEVLHSDGDLQDFTANLEDSLISARDSYGVPESVLQEFASRLLTSLESDSFLGLSSALDVATRLELAPEMITRIEERALRTPGADPGVRVMALASRMTQLSEDLEQAKGSVTHGR